MLNRLSILYELQLIDDQLDELEELRGDLPLAVNELKNQISSITENIATKESDKAELLEKRKHNESEIERLNENLKKFKAQLYKVRNNKEYDALTKEIDHSEEKIKELDTENMEAENIIEKIKFEVEELQPQVDELEEKVKKKEAELKKIIKANEREEVKLREKREKVASQIRKSDYHTYMRIRKALGGIAVASISRGACTGCHNVVPSQRQIEIRGNRRLFTCESCGRLLVSGEIAEEVHKRLNL